MTELVTFTTHSGEGLFTLHESWEGREIFVGFEGVSSAFSVWVNGELVGYGQGSRMPSEFRVNPYVRKGTWSTFPISVMKRATAFRSL